MNQDFREALKYLISSYKESRGNLEVLINFQELLKDISTKSPKDIDISKVPLDIAFEVILNTNLERITEYNFPWEDIISGKSELGKNFVEAILINDGIYKYLAKSSFRQTDGKDNTYYVKKILVNELIDKKIINHKTFIDSDSGLNDILSFSLSKASHSFLYLLDTVKDSDFNHENLAKALVILRKQSTIWNMRDRDYGNKNPYSEIIKKVVSIIDWNKVDLNSNIDNEVLGVAINDIIFSALKYQLHEKIRISKKRPQSVNVKKNDSEVEIDIDEGFLRFYETFAKSKASDNFKHTLKAIGKIRWGIMMDSYNSSKKEESINVFLSEPRFIYELSGLLSFIKEKGYQLTNEQKKAFAKLMPKAIASSVFQGSVGHEARKELMVQPVFSNQVQDNGEAIKNCLKVLEAIKNGGLIDDYFINEVINDVSSLGKNISSFSMSYASSISHTEEQRLMVKWASLAVNKNNTKKRINKI